VGVYLQMPLLPVVQLSFQAAIEGEFPFNEVLRVPKARQDGFKPRRGGAGAAQRKVAVPEFGGGKPFAGGVQAAETAIIYERGQAPLGMNPYFSPEFLPDQGGGSTLPGFSAESEFIHIKNHGAGYIPRRCLLLRFLGRRGGAAAVLDPLQGIL